MKREYAWFPLAIVVFLAPLIGGKAIIDSLPVMSQQNGFILTILGAHETPVLSHALLSVFYVVAFWWGAISQRVIAIPKNLFMMSILLFGAFILLSLSVSAFKLTSATYLCEWIIYIGVFFTASAVTGRGKGPIGILSALVAGCALVAVLGILEYGTMRNIDPTWRIFSTWVNANGLAGMLLIGFIAGLGLTIEGERVNAIAFGAATSLIGFALVLTQSRGAFLALAGALVLFVLMLAFAPGPPQERRLVRLLFLSVTDTFVRRLARVAACLAISACLVVLLVLSGKARTAHPDTVSALTRISTSPDHARDQSSGFRRLLWKSSIDLVKKNPVGYGIGTFRYESARPGMTTATQFGHQSFLQLAVEAGPVALACFALLGIAWIIEMLKGFRKGNQRFALTRGIILVAILASVFHSFVDSDLYLFGIGITFFTLLGVGLSVASDGVSPEFLPSPVRWMSVAIATVPVIALFYIGFEKLKVSQGYGALIAQDRDTAQRTLDEARSLGIDGEAWYFGSRLFEPGAERVQYLSKAVSLTPSPKYYRALAREQVNSGNAVAGAMSLNEALLRDPNNLETLVQLMRLYIDTGDFKAAATVANRLVEVEQKPYYQVRAIPELIPTETFEARLYLGIHERDELRKVSLLRPAVDGILEYLHKTVPQVLVYQHSEQPMDFAGENLVTARKALELGREASTRLLKVYRSLHRLDDVAVLESAVKELDAGLAGLDKDAK